MRMQPTRIRLHAGGPRAAGRSGPTRRRFWLALALGVPLLATAPEPPPAFAALRAGAGYDYQSGPGARTTQGPLAFVVVPVRQAALTVAAFRYFDSQDEDGVGGTTALVAPLGGLVSARGELSRIVGDGVYRAWRYRIGPQVALTDAAWIYPYYLRNEDNRSAALNAIGADASYSLTPTLAAQGSASFTSRAGEPSGGQGMAGFLWSPASRIQLLAQAGFGRSSLFTTGSGPNGGGGGLMNSLPDVGGRVGPMSPRTQTTEESAYTTALSLGIRVLFP